MLSMRLKILKNKDKFVKFSLIWYGQQFAIPFWIVGHIHLHFHDYHDIVELISSVLMHLAVAGGFWLDWLDYNKEV